MARLRPSNGTQREEDTGAEATGRGVGLRTAVLGIAALAAGYLVGRRLWRGGTPATGDLRERAGEALPGEGVDVPIGGTDEDEEGGDEEGGADATGEAADEAAASGPSPEEIDERTEADVEEEPAEPGEMQVDEELAEEAMDGDVSSDETAADEDEGEE